jgi:hypothetical protein
MLFGNAGIASAANTITFPEDTNLVLSGPSITLQILQNSVASSLDITATDFTVVVDTGGAFTVRYPGPPSGDLANDGGLDSCQAVGSNNEVTVTGPMTVTFTPSATPTCTTAGSGPLPPTAAVSQPNGGESWNAASSHDILWSTGGTGVTGVRLSYSTNGGSTWTLIVDNLSSSNGFYSWTVPSVNTTQAKVKVEALGNSSVLATDVSDSNFTIVYTAPSGGGGGGGGGGTITPPPPVIPPPVPTGNGIEGADTSGTGAGAKSRTEANLILPPAFPVDSLVKLVNDNDPTTQADTTVYYLGLDAKRHPFASGATYQTWYSDFSAVKTIDAVTLASIPMGVPILSRPGTTMVKIASDPKTYYVEPGYRLRWVTDEATAVKLFGSDWNRNVIDIDVSLYLRFVTGEPITLASLDTTWPSGSLLRLPSSLTNWYVQAGQKRAFASVGAFEANNFQNRFVLTDFAPVWLTMPAGSDITGQEDGLFSLMH